MQQLVSLIAGPQTGEPYSSLLLHIYLNMRVRVSFSWPQEDLASAFMILTKRADTTSIDLCLCLADSILHVLAEGVHRVENYT